MRSKFKKPSRRASSIDRGVFGRRPALRYTTLAVERLEERALLALGLGYAFDFGNGGDNRGRSVAADPAGNVYVAGYVSGNVDFDPGPGQVNLPGTFPGDVFVAKYSPTGALAWAHLVGGEGFGLGRSPGIAVDAAGNVYTTGMFSGTVDFDPSPTGTFNLSASSIINDAFVSKFDTNGNFVYAGRFGGFFPTEGNAIAVDAAGNMYITGAFQGAVDFDPGPANANAATTGATDIFVTKLDRLGNFQWVRGFGSSGFDEGFGIAVDGSGNVYTTGEYVGTTDFDPSPGGTTTLAANGFSEAFVSKLNAAGDFVWARGFGDTAKGIALDSAGNIHVTGVFAGPTDFGGAMLTSGGIFGDAFITKLNPAGVTQWARALEINSVFDMGNAIALDSAGNVYTTGDIGNSTVDLDPGAGVFVPPASANFFNGYISKLDSAGNFVEAARIGGIGSGIAVDPTGRVYTTGHFQASGDFDPGTGTNILNAQLLDVFLLQFTQPPVGPAGPEVQVEGNSLVIQDEDATPSLLDDTDFGSVQIGDVVSRTFTVRNTGGSSLAVSALTAPPGFNVTEPLNGPLAPGASDTFTIALDTATAGAKAGQISFTTNDADEPVFNFTIAATVNVPLGPEVEVEGSGQDIQDDNATPDLLDGTDFGTQPLGATVTTVFTVRNAGVGTLTLGPVNLPAGFSLAEPLVGSLGAGSSDTFTVRLDTATTGVKSGQVSFTTSDANEPDFNFNITGNVINPEVKVEGNGQDILDGDNTPSVADDTDFGAAAIDALLSKTFTVRNTGVGTLTLGAVSVPGGFVLDEPLASSLGPGGFDTFTVRLDTAIGGVKSGTVSFTTNDADEPTFDFNITGTVTFTAMAVEGNGQIIANGDASPSLLDNTDFGAVVQGGAPISKTFTVRNSGTGALLLGSLSLPLEFIPVDPLASSIASGGFDTFSILLNTASAGNHGGQVSFTTNDPDNLLFSFTISGSVAGAGANVEGNGLVILDGDTTPRLLDHTDFGVVSQGSLVSRTFTVENNGAVDLSLSGLTASGGFQVTDPLSPLLAPGGSDTFTVQMDTSLPGFKGGQVAFATSDASVPLFNFNIAGAVVPPPSISIEDGQIIEGNSGQAFAQFLIRLSAASSQGVTLAFATSDGSAQVADVDYIATSGALTIAPGQTTALVQVAVQGDVAEEPDESFSVTLSAATNATLADNTALGTIRDDDAPGVISINSITLVEGDFGQQTALFGLSLASPRGQDTTVNFATANGAALAGQDYIAASGIVTFTAGQTTASIAVQVLGDLIDEPTETFQVDLSAPTGATLAQPFAVGTILDNSDPQPAILISNASIVEGDAGSADAVFQVTLSAATGKTVTVDFATINASAAAPQDFVASAGALTFLPGDVSKQIRISVLGDVQVETPETFHVQLSNLQNAIPLATLGVGAILPDDARLTIGNVTVFETNLGTAALFPVTLSQPASAGVTLDYATTDGSAVAGQDYSFTSGSLQFTPSQTIRVITVPILGNTIHEPTEAFQVLLTNIVGAAEVASSAGSATILDDDPVPAVSIRDVSIAENGPGPLVVTFELSSASSVGHSLTAVLQSADGSARLDNADYNAVSVNISLSFAPGETAKTVALSGTVNSDSAFEPNETFLLNLVGPSGLLVADGQAVVTVTNDDPPPTFPEVAVSFAGQDITDNDSLPGALDGTDFGSAVQAAAPVTRTFLVSNVGTALLNLSGLIVPIGFTILDGLAASLPPGGVDAITVQLETALVGAKNGQISFATDDSDENPFNFSISGVINSAPALPELAVSSAGQNILDEDASPSSFDGTDFGSALQGSSPVTRSYLVSNFGTAPLNLSGLSVPAGFTILDGLVASLPPGGSDAFSVQLDTSVAGTKSGSISFSNNDADENPFNFSISGTINSPPAFPEVTVRFAGQNIADNDASPGNLDGTDFGRVLIGAPPVSRSYLVRNDGTAQLNLGALIIPAGFTLVDGLAPSLPPGGSDVLTLQLDTAAIGTKIGQISFTTDDGDESPFNFSITGAVDPLRLLVTSSDAGFEQRVRVLDAATRAERFGFFAYPGFTGGVRVATGDINGDGSPDIITAAGPGGGPHVRVFDGVTGLPLAGVIGSFYAYNPAFGGGVFVASGDVNADGRDDIITGAGAGGGPHVRVFSGVDGSELLGFFAYQANFGGGVSVAAGDVNGDGFDDVITGAGAGGGPHVRVFSGAERTELFGFFAYSANFGGGVFVAAGDVNADGRADIYTGAGAGGGPHVRVISGANQTVLRSFFAYSVAFTGGVRVAAGDLNGDGRDDIITGAGFGGGMHVKGFSGANLTELVGFFAYTAFAGAVFVAGSPGGGVSGALAVIDGASDMAIPSQQSILAAALSGWDAATSTSDDPDNSAEDDDSLTQRLDEPVQESDPAVTSRVLEDVFAHW